MRATQRIGTLMLSPRPRILLLARALAEKHYMRNKFCLLLLISFVVVGGAPAQTPKPAATPKNKTKVTTRYDKKKQQTTVTLEPLELVRAPAFDRTTLTLKFVYPGKTIKKPEFVSLRIYSTSAQRFWFGRPQELILDVDGERLNLGEAQWQGQISRATAPLPDISMETLVISIPFDSYARFAQAQKPVLAVGRHDFRLTEKQAEALRNFASLMQEEGLEF